MPENILFMPSSHNKNSDQQRDREQTIIDQINYNRDIDDINFWIKDWNNRFSDRYKFQPLSKTSTDGISGVGFKNQLLNKKATLEKLRELGVYDENYVPISHYENKINSQRRGGLIRRNILTNFSKFKRGGIVKFAPGGNVQQQIVDAYGGSAAEIQDLMTKDGLAGWDKGKIKKLQQVLRSFYGGVKDDGAYGNQSHMAFLRFKKDHGYGDDWKADNLLDDNFVASHMDGAGRWTTNNDGGSKTTTLIDPETGETHQTYSNGKGKTLYKLSTGNLGSLEDAVKEFDVINQLKKNKVQGVTEDDLDKMQRKTTYKSADVRNAFRVLLNNLYSTYGGGSQYLTTDKNGKKVWSADDNFNKLYMAWAKHNFNDSKNHSGFFGFDKGDDLIIYDNMSKDPEFIKAKNAQQASARNANLKSTLSGNIWGDYFRKGKWKKYKGDDVYEFTDSKGEVRTLFNNGRYAIARNGKVYKKGNYKLQNEGNHSYILYEDPNDKHLYNENRELWRSGERG